MVSLANLEPALCEVAVRSADPALRAEVMRLTEAYQLTADDWFRHVKRALRACGVIASDRTVLPTEPR